MLLLLPLRLLHQYCTSAYCIFYFPEIVFCFTFQFNNDHTRNLCSKNNTLCMELHGNWFSEKMDVRVCVCAVCTCMEKYFVLEIIGQNKQESVQPIFNMIVCVCVIFSAHQQFNKIPIQSFCRTPLLVSLHDAWLVLAIAKIYQYKFTSGWTKFGHVRKNRFIDRKPFYLRRMLYDWVEWEDVKFEQIVSNILNHKHNFSSTEFYKLAENGTSR